MSIDLDEYFLAIAHLTAKKFNNSDDGAGAVIATDKNYLIGYGGQGGLAKALSNGHFDHATMKAISNAQSSPVSGAHVRGCVIYCTRIPCKECAIAIARSGIKELFYIFGRESKEEEKEVKDFFDFVKIKYYQKTFVAKLETV